MTWMLQVRTELGKTSFSHLMSSFLGSNSDPIIIHTFSSLHIKGIKFIQYFMCTQQNILQHSTLKVNIKNLSDKNEFCITVIVLTPFYVVHSFRKIYYMKPQTGTRTSAHSFLEQYIQSYLSRHALQILSILR